MRGGRSAEYRRLINSARWRRLRAEVLAESPLCPRCAQAGLVRSAAEVHHIVPVESGPTPAARERLAYSRTNLTALCRNCHAEVHREMLKGSAAETRRRAAEESAAFMERMFGSSLDAHER